MSDEPVTSLDLDALLASDLGDRCVRLDLGDALASAGRHEEAWLARDLLLPLRAEGGRLVRAPASGEAPLAPPDAGLQEGGK